MVTSAKPNLHIRNLSQFGRSMSTSTLFTVSTIIISTNNSTHQSEEQSKVSQTIALVFLMILSIVANTSISVVVLRDRELRSSVRNLVLASLAYADLLMTQVMLFYLLSLHEVITELTKQVCIGFTRLHGILVYVSVLHLFILSIDKYVAVFYPLRYAQKITIKRLLKGLCLVWIIPIITVGLAPEFTMDEKPNNRSSTTIVECMNFPAYSTSERQQSYIVLNAVFLFGIPLLCMLITYFKIAKVSWYQSNRVDHEPRDVARRTRSARTRAREMKWAKTIGIMVGAFILCYLPIIAMLLRQALHGLEPTVSQAILFLSFTNSLINPVIYCLRSRDYRKAFFNLCSKDSEVIADCIASKNISRTSKVTKSKQKHEGRAPGMAKGDNISELSTGSTSYSFVISRALFQKVLAEVLEDGNC